VRGATVIMYCEIVFKHKKEIPWEELKTAIGGKLGQEIPLEAAYKMSAIYRNAPPNSSLLSFETLRNCFVIVRSVNYDSCTYHLEGNNPAVSLATMLETAGEFAGQLKGVFRASNYEAPDFVVRLFEDNGRETGTEGQQIKLIDVFREKFSWKELRSSVIPFLTTLLLIWLGLKQEPFRASIYSFVIVIVFALADVAVTSWQGHGKINWKSRQN